MLAALDAMTDGVACVDADGRVLHANRALGDLVGCAAPDLIGCSVEDFVRPREGGAADRRGKLLAGAIGPYEVVEHLLHRSGGIVPARVRVSRSGPPGPDAFLVQTFDAVPPARQEPFDSLPGLLGTLDSIMEGCQVVDREYRYIYLNDAAERHARRPRASLLGRTMEACYPGIEATPFFAALRRCLDHDISERLDNEFVYPDGTRAWFEISVQPQPAGATILSIDITARKVAEDELRRQRDMLQRMAESSPVGITRLDREGRIVFANARAAEILGVDREEVTRRTYNSPAWRITDDAGRPVADADLPFARVRRERRVVEDVRHALEFSDGRRVLLSVNAAPLMEGSEFQGMVASLDDVTARTHALERLRESEERFRQIANHVEEVFWMTDPSKGEILYVSPAYERIWGRSLLGFTVNAAAWLDAIHPDDRARVVERLPRQAEGTFDEEYRVVRPDGTLRWIRDRAFPVRDAAGNVHRVVGVAEDVTEWRNAAEALRRSEEALRVTESQLRTFVEQAPADIAMFDRDMVYLAASNRWIAMWGRGRTSLVGLGHYDVNPDLPDRWKEIHRRALAGETLHSDDDEWVQMDGQVRSLRWLVQPWRATGGAEISGIVVLAEDITEWKRAQQALLTERTLLRTTFDLLPDLIYVKDLDHRFLASNAACARYMGASSPEELVGRTDADYYPAEMARRFREDEARVMSEGRALVDHKEVIIRDGATRSFLNTKVPLTDGRGTVLGLVGVTRDVSELERVAARLRTQHAVTRVLADARSLADAAPRLMEAIAETAGGSFAGFWEVDRGAGVLRCVAQWKRADLDADDLVAQTATMTFRIGAGLPGRVWESRRPLVIPDIASDPDFVRRESAGRASLAAAFALPIVARDEVAGVMDFLDHANRAPDAELLDMLGAVATQIGQFIEHRRAEEQFMQAQKMEAVGQLAGGIAHDFNNLLGVIVAYAEMARRDLGESRAGRRVEAIQKAAERAAALTRQILTFSRRQPTVQVDCDLNVVVEEMEKMLRRLIGEDVRLVVVLGADLGHVRADRSQLEQVILNLCVNARDAMPTGGRLVIETCKMEVTGPLVQGPFDLRPGPCVVLSVSDTGLGMSAETLPHIFEPFFTTKEQGKGTGLGLAVVYGVVRQSGGSVSVYSEPGRGTTFKVYLPRVDAAPVADAVPAGDRRGGTETLLLVEDEGALRAVVAEALTSEGYDVVEARDPEQALVVASHSRAIQLVITDVVLPGRSGPEVADEVRLLHPGARVLLVSGYTDRILEGHQHVDPRTPFLGKPFTIDALLRKVREILDAEPPAPPDTGSGDPPDPVG